MSAEETMTTKSMRAWLVALVAFVLLVVAVDSTGVVSDDTAVVVDDAAQLTAGVAATVACWWASRRCRGHERTWRVLMAVGMGGWSVGMCFWSWYQIFSDTPLPSPSWADVGFLTMPAMALPALLSLAVGPSRHVADGQRHSSVVFFLDGLVVVGSLFVLTWATSLGAVVDSVAPNSLAFAVAVAYPTTDLVLVVIVVLLTVTRRVTQHSFVQLGLLGSGLVAISISDSIFAYLISTGAEEMPPLSNAGFVGGPLLIALAGLATADATTSRRQVPLRAGAARAHLLLPYALVLLTGSVIAIQTLTGAHIDRVEATLAWAVLNLVIVRQMVTLMQNTALLERVSAAQAELAHRAHHDPLTGLANRALFGERLRTAVDRHRHDRAHFALMVVDLDDFKAVNDGFGHNTGDLLLHAVGERLRHCVRAGDTVARLGGDEFAVVLDGGVEHPEVVSHRILAALEQPFEIDGTTLSVSASLGVVEPGGDDTDLTADVVLRRADGAMYLGKRRGKGVAVHYRPELAGELPFPTVLPERPTIVPATP
jgi:diguanylate cyclase (GGDEF)-like protein